MNPQGTHNLDRSRRQHIAPAAPMPNAQNGRAPHGLVLTMRTLLNISMKTVLSATEIVKHPEALSQILQPLLTVVTLENTSLSLEPKRQNHDLPDLNHLALGRQPPLPRSLGRDHLMRIRWRRTTTAVCTIRCAASPAMAEAAINPLIKGAF